jgi:hypothetical protein
METAAGVNGEVVYKVRTGAKADLRGTLGVDSCVMAIPELVYRRLDGRPVLVMSLLGRLLRQVSQHFAAELGKVLHHADWVITGDPVRVRDIAMHEPNCANCAAGCERGLEYLAEHPGAELLCGRLYWAA